jgi:hypothetical protein
MMKDLPLSLMKISIVSLLAHIPGPRSSLSVLFLIDPNQWLNHKKEKLLKYNHKMPYLKLLSRIKWKDPIKNSPFSKTKT